MSKRQDSYGLPDRRDESGKWIGSWTTYEDEQRVTNYSRAYSLWKGIKNRCLSGGAFQKAGPTYVGCSNGFENFQQFAEWATNQPGYSEIDHQGMPFQLDKDILLPGNKAYSPEACCFVPRRINSLLTSSKAARGGLPIGVHFLKARGKFSAYCNGGSGMKYLGLFEGSMEAHRSWQIEKSLVINDAAFEYSNTKGFNQKVVSSLQKISRSILEDAENYRETKDPIGACLDKVREMNQ